jgi:hypothetical protein
MFLNLVLFKFRLLCVIPTLKRSPAVWVTQTKHQPEETEPAQGHVARNRFECPSPNRKRPITRLAKSGQMAASTNQRGKAVGGCGSVEEEQGGGPDEEDSKLHLMHQSSALIQTNTWGNSVWLDTCKA